MLYFVPARVAEEYKKIAKKPHKHTMPIVKRKLSAMVHATKWCRELIDEENQIYHHKFNGIHLIVEEKKRCISKVYKTFLFMRDDRSAKYYHRLCKRLGLNGDRNDFRRINNMVEIQ